VTTSSSKPSKGNNHTCGERGILLTKPHDLCFGGVQNKVKSREANWMLRKLYCRVFNTKYGEGPVEYKTLSSAYK
jgi:hypothetical protein